MYWIISICLSLLALALFIRWLSKPLVIVDPEPATVTTGKYGWESPVFCARGTFFIKPWLQPGNAPGYDASGLVSAELLWHTEGYPPRFHVEVRPASVGWTGDTPVLRFESSSHEIAVVGVPAQTQHKSIMTGLKPGLDYRYRVFANDQLVFESFFTARKARGEPFRAVVFGDMGSGSPWQAEIAYRISQPDGAPPAYEGERQAPAFVPGKPRGADLMLCTGDIVYQHGRYAEYLSRFFPVYQTETPNPAVGAPLLDKIMILPCVGNHDMAKYDPETLITFSEYPDLMAYFALWSLPLNGPDGAHELGENDLIKEAAHKAKNRKHQRDQIYYREDGTPMSYQSPYPQIGQLVGANIPPMQGSESARAALIEAAAGRYPRMANYSYDYGLAHFLFLDADTYMDWCNEELRDWVRKDLRAVPAGFWKVVVLHQPPFTSNRKHQREQGMRHMADIFEQEGVSLVLCGHAHSYERSYPIKFRVAPPLDFGRRKGGYVGGSIEMDPHYDGETNTHPDGVIYVVSGGGGAKLDSKDLHGHPELWQHFTRKLVGDRHSFSIIDFEEDKLVFRQIDISGVEVDRFVISARK